jgi:sulfur carrier protein ThiS
MNVTVKLFGDLKRKIPDYKPEKGLEMEIPEGSKVADLLALLRIPTSPGATVIMEGRVLPLEERLSQGSLINLFHVMYGG